MAKLTIKDALSTSLTRTKQYIDTELAKKANSSHGTHLTLGTGSGNAFRGDYGNTAYQHSQTAHAPSNAQKNSDITKAEIEAKLTGAITSHTHSYLPLSGGQVTGKVYLTTGATSTDASHPTQLAYGLLGAYGTLKVLGNTDTSAGADNEYVHIASGWGLNPDANKGITVHGTYANCFGKKISTEGHTHDHLKVQLNGGTTEGTNQFTFDGSAAKTINITPSSIGAAPTSHASTATTYGAASASNYGHAIASSTTPKANGTAAVGNETAKFARGDHVHPLQTTVSGNAGTATKLATARTINGTNFDGSANITTANWGTARTLTIGNKGQSVNGSGNVSWALSDIMGRATTTSSADTNKNKYTKFARVDISGGAYRSCTGTFDFVSVESGHVFGILTYYLRTGSAITSTSITLAWKTLTNVAYASSVVAVKVSDGIFDLYYKPVNDWDTMSITNINSNGIGYITLYSSQSFVSSVTATATSSLVNHSATAAKLTTARSITIGNKSNNFDGSGNISFTLSDIGAAAAHNHPYLPTAGGTMTGKITTPNNAQGITIGDDVSLCDRNIADHLVLEGSTATNGGITFGSGKDTNIYRGGANLLKTDDTMNAVGGFQWNGQSLDNRYAASSHGTHVSYGGNGSATTVSRSDHTHSYLPLSGGTVTGATTFNNYLKINAWSGYGTGTADIWYDGTNKTVEIDGVTDLKLGETKVTKGAYTIWTGSQTDYNNISSKSSTTLYFIK